MEKTQLGRTGIDVTEICLGTMTWGQQNTPKEAFSQLDMALDYGVSFIDTAEMYSVPAQATTYGSTETIIGNWLEQRGGRDNLTLASKVAGPGNWLPHIRDGETRFNRKHIVAALNDSLRRLKTDYIDLYQLHWPDRNTNFFGSLGYSHQDSEQITPIEETLGVLSELVDTGKIRHIGVSNETPWGTLRFLDLAEQNHWPRIASIQNPYNLLNRSYEVGLAEISMREDAGLLAYSPLAFGMLTGKYLNNQWPENARLTLFKQFSRYNNPQSLAAAEAYTRIANRHGIDPAQMALAFVRQQPFVTSVIIGATNLDQLKSNLESSQLNLNGEILGELDAVHVMHPNPAP